MNTAGRMKALTLAGRIILENGGETYRAEDTVLRMATVNGAMLQGRDDTGCLAVGKKADIVLLDKDLNLRGVMACGEWVEGTLKV